MGYGLQEPAFSWAGRGEKGCGECGRLIMAPKGNGWGLASGACECYLIWNKGFCRCDEVKDVEMGNLLWNILVGAFSHMNPYPGGRWREIRPKRRQDCNHGGRDQSVVATYRGMSAAPRSSWKKQGMDSPLELLEEVWPCWQLISDLWPPELLGNKFLLF